MTLQYEFEIVSKSDKANVFDFIKKNFKFKVKVIENNKCIYNSSSSINLYNIVSKIFKLKMGSINYIIKRDDDNDILEVLYDTDVNFYNSEVASEKENKILELIYNNLN